MKVHVELELSQQYFEEFHGESISPSQKGVRRVKSVCS